MVVVSDSSDTRCRGRKRKTGSVKGKDGSEEGGIHQDNSRKREHYDPTVNA